MFNFRTATEVAAYCAATVVFGTGALFAAGTFDSEVTGIATVVNFHADARGESGRITDLRGCDVAPETGTFYEVGVCADHEAMVGALK